MSMDNALAAGQGGTEAAPQSQTLAHENQPNTPLARLQEDNAQPDEHDNADASDDARRRRIVERLSAQLDTGVYLSEICERLAESPEKDRLEAVHAAARLAQTNAQLAKALAQLLQAEPGQRLIVGRIQAPAPGFGHSNASEQSEQENPSERSEQGMLIDGLTTKLLRCLDVMAGEKFDPMLKKAEEDARAKANPAPAAAA